MLFFTRFYFPNLSTSDLEQAFDKFIKSKDVLSWEPDNYQTLLNLKKHASRITISLSELKAIHEIEEIDTLYSLIGKAINQALSYPDFNPAAWANQLQNHYSLMLHKIEEDNNEKKFFSGFNMFTNAITATAGALGIVLFGAAIGTGPLGMALLAACMTLASTLVFVIAAYSLYVDGRYLADKQLTEVKDGIDFLCKYPNVEPVQNEYHDDPTCSSSQHAMQK